MKNNPLTNWLMPVFLLLSLSVAAQEYGVASYYSDRYQGRRTAYGDTYDKSKKTCSHKLHPYGTLLKITRLDNKKSVVCKVIDKGPYTKGRIVDLSRAAAEEIDLVSDGTAEVKVEVYRPGGETQEIVRTPSPPATSPQTASPPPPQRATQEDQVASPPKSQPAPTVAAAAPAQKTTAEKTNNLVQDFSKYGLYRIRLEQGPKAGYAVQVMVVSDYERVMRAIASYQGQALDNILVSIEPGPEADQALFKILLGPFDTEEVAKNFQNNLKNKYKINGFLVNLTDKDYTPVASQGN